MSWDDRIIFTDQLWKAENQAYLEIVQHPQHILKPRKVMTLGEALNQKALAMLPQEIQNIEIWFATNVNGYPLNGAVLGVLNGNNIIVINPQQATNEYVPALLHEIKHLIDKIQNKQVPPNEELSRTDYQAYKRSPAERRARNFERSFVNNFRKKNPDLFPKDSSRLNWLQKISTQDRKFKLNEKIITAAVRIGKAIFTGISHLFAEMKAIRAGWLIKSPNEDKYTGKDGLPWEEGFITNRHQFLSRSEAAQYFDIATSENMEMQHSNFASRMNWLQRISSCSNTYPVNLPGSENLAELNKW